MNFMTALRKEWMEQGRTFRLLVVGVVLVVFGLLSPVIAKYTPEIIKLIPNGEAIAELIPTPTASDAVAQYIKNTSQFGVILALLLTMGAISQEKSRSTAAMMLVKPLPRGTFLAAKFVSRALMFVAAIVLAGAACYYYTWLLFGPLDLPGWLGLNGLMILYLMVYIALTLFCSVLTRSQVAAGGLALGLLFLFSLIGSIPGVGQYLPGQLIAWGGDLMAGGTEAFWPAVGISVGMIAVSLLGAKLIFDRQEL
ncbi:MAG: ABC transporter permease subunit [Anaerolineales bacterium]|jgi:ABC-2 type transport system permease protein